MHWDGLLDHLRDVLWEDIIKLGVSMSAVKFCEWVQDEINVYITHCKYQVKSHSSPWFSAVYAAFIAHRNHFFHLQQQKSTSKVRSRQASNYFKRVLETARLAYANKTRDIWLLQLLANC